MESFGGDTPDLFGDIDDALCDPHPLGLLELASSLLSVTEPDRSAGSPLAQRTAAPPVDRAQLIDSFIDVDARETSAVLTVWAEMLDDDVLRARLREGRRHSLPQWLRQLDQVRPVRAIEHGHVLGDGENIYLGVETPGRSFTIAIYVDHNMGTIVKDAFCIELPVSEVIRRTDELDDEDGWMQELLLEDAAAKLRQAIENGELLLDPVVTDTWPQCKPLVEWMARLLPEGGEGYAWTEPTDAEWTALQKDFAASAFSDGFTTEGFDRADTLFQFATFYGSGDPLRWSAVVAEIVLLDMIPRKVIAEKEYLRGFPDTLRAVVRYAHDRHEIASRHTDAALAAIDRFTPEYLEAISQPRRQGPEALLERMGMLPPLDSEFDETSDLLGEPWGDLTDEEFFLGLLAERVGGIAALDALEVDPLPDEELDLSQVDADIVERVREVAALADGVAMDFFEDAELRTAQRRALARIAVADPSIFRRAGRTDTAAAALSWLVAKANDALSWGGEHGSQAMMAHLGLKGSPSQRAQPMLRALGMDPYRPSYAIALGDPGLLTSSARRQLIERRDAWRAREE